MSALPKFVLGTVLALTIGAAASAAIAWGISMILIPPEAPGVPTHREGLRNAIVAYLAFFGALVCATTFLLRIPSIWVRISCPVAAVLLVIAILSFSAHATVSEAVIVLAIALVALSPAAFIGWFLSQHV